MKKNRPSAAYLSAVVAGLIAGSLVRRQRAGAGQGPPRRPPRPRRRTRTPVAAPTAAAARSRRQEGRPRGDRQARLQGAERLQGQGRLQDRQERLQGPQRLQGDGRLRHRRKGPHHADPEACLTIREREVPAGRRPGTSPWKHEEEDTFGQSLEPARSRLRHRPSDGPLRRHPRPPSRGRLLRGDHGELPRHGREGRCTSSTGWPSGRRSSSTACR